MGQLEDAVNVDVRLGLEDRLRHVKATLKEVQNDQRMLHEYMVTDNVTDDTGLHQRPQPEQMLPAVSGTAVSTKPVVRILDGAQDCETIFTRFAPGSKQQSIILRKRCGLHQLVNQLTATAHCGAKSVRRWDVYICTHAEQSYALEVCK